jgi:hypothetical protein
MRALLLLLVALATAPAAAGERVDLLQITNFGYLQEFHAQEVEFEATYAGPLQQPLLPVPARLQEDYVTAAFFPPRWSESPLRGTGLVEPLTAFVRKAKGAWVFSLRPGSQVVVRGRFEVVTAPSAARGMLPTDFPLIEVQEILSVDTLRRLEETTELAPPAPGAEESAVVVRRRARLEALRGSIDKATTADLTPEERIRRRELLIALRDRLDAAGIRDPALRRETVLRTLRDLAFPPLQAGEEP